ncbi:MAG: hypothetical protein WD645_06755 [Dehalococcoidia bacterium]
MSLPNGASGREKHTPGNQEVCRMGIESLKKGDKLQLSDGATVEVTGPAENGAVPVVFIDAPFGTEKPGDTKNVENVDIYGIYTDASLSVIRSV